MDTSTGAPAIPDRLGHRRRARSQQRRSARRCFRTTSAWARHAIPKLIQRIGEVTAIEVAVTGIDWTFAPTVAVVRDDRWGRTYEGYSEDPEIVRTLAERHDHSASQGGTRRTPTFLRWQPRHRDRQAFHRRRAAPESRRGSWRQSAHRAAAARHPRSRLFRSVGRGSAGRHGLVQQLAWLETAWP